MLSKEFTSTHRSIGITSSWVLSVLLVLYAITLLLGLISLQSPDDPIGNPYFTILESLIILMMPFMVLVMVILHSFAVPEKKAYSMTSLVMMIITAGITSSVHFAVLTLSRQPVISEIAGINLVFSFSWPSIVYALDILAWDWFFALSLLFAAVVIVPGKYSRIVRALMISGGILSLAGLTGVPLADMQVRMIGVVGYAGITPFLFFFLGKMFRETNADTKNPR